MSQRTKRNRKQQQQPEEKEEEENGASGTNGHDEDAASSSTTTFKIPSASSKTAIINDDDDNKSEQIITEEIVDCIKTDDDDIVTTIESDRVITTRSRSNTPQIKVTRNESIDSNNIDETVTITEQEVLLVKENGATAASSSQPLLATVVDDEADPELLFDDDDNNSDDFLLGKASPIVMMTRCKTRRSQISRTTSPETPKTPKKSPVLVSEEKVTVNNDPNTNIIVEAEEKEENDEGKDALNATTSNNNDNKRRGVDISDDDDDDDILLSDISTKVHVGGDATNISCLDSFINTTRNNTTSGSLKIKTKVDNNKSSVIIDDDDDDKESSFLHTSKKRTMGETLRGLTSRRTIRPIHANYYNNKSIIFNKHNKDGRSFTSSSNNDSKNNILLLDYPSRQNSIDRISLSSKRKRCSESVENLKRFKSDSVRSSSTAGGGGLLSIFTSPLMTNVRNRFYSNLVASSTPKLTGYKDDVLVVGDDVRSHGNDDERKEEIYERKWCAIM